MRKFLDRMKCRIFGHKAEVVDVSCTGSTEKVFCERCRGFYGMNHDAKAILIWDSSLEQCFAAGNNRHSKYWPQNRKWLDLNN